MSKSLILASASPRRRELLSQLGYEFTILISNIDEIRNQDESPSQYVQRLAESKAKTVLQQACVQGISDPVVIGSDTIVTQGECVFEKPESLQDSIEMLGQLSNAKHQVMTAVCVSDLNKTQTIICITDVWFKPLSLQEIKDYWLTDEPCDKAGSYGIQGIGGKFVTRIEGSYHSVVGLPLFETEQLLHQFF
ncbi:septum formation protein Maf [Vibrio sp. UCD-FRSSP16_10]|uniref:Maf family protein n=1 Tax=unclassified Vibrio TaxID=2614977 RepID=UPI0007FE3294|nr:MULTISPECIES: Maf family protein [unclassified Vibrio]OBT17433.1 septum formation protein Maf [Vibrio sp. UCD-FRSSP16_30]OBT23202.1 septum formation protein Maf [Vibrio sp. UCD-FRSSP16_10]